MQLMSPFPLKSFNTFGLDAQAKMGFVLSNEAELDTLRGSAWWSDCQPRLLIGEGSNILFTVDFDGLVIVNRLKGISVQETADAWLLHVAAGENWPALIQWTLQHQMPGMENLALIPGTVGAAPVQNIGAYGVEFCQFCEYVDTWHFADGHRQRYSATACQFGYRDSLFKQTRRYVVTSVIFRLNNSFVYREKYSDLNAELHNSTHPDLKQVREAVIRVRTRKLPDPTLLPNAGSFFKNPSIPLVQFNDLKQKFEHIPGYPNGDLVKVPAGWLIEQCGWKGKQIGNVASHKLQALVIVNATGEASGEEIFDFSTLIIDSVKEKFGIELEREVNIL